MKKTVNFAPTLNTIYSNWYKYFENMYDNRSLGPHNTVKGPPPLTLRKVVEGLHND